MAGTVTGLTQEDGHTIGFVLGCYFTEAIDLAELRKWCEHVIITNEVQDIPQYMFDLVSVASPGEILSIIGFSAGGVSRQEDEALYGIAFGRGRDVFDPPLGPVEAKRALQTKPDVLQRFRDVFPFIELMT
ncbi:hypothetical protein [Nocardia fluminea]|uniref:Uncharacterized protein n=1 Tax=Nocardia fluminea TaxID=134984 RepID=A0A2N3VDQ4_9NOCA|nr:hypothetical protein [Nocardia fluminea]PKV79748.1 hypothetical protein ATK86_4159 [Nocardia fluminea]